MNKIILNEKTIENLFHVMSIEKHYYLEDATWQCEIYLLEKTNVARRYRAAIFKDGVHMYDLYFSSRFDYLSVDSYFDMKKNFYVPEENESILKMLKNIITYAELPDYLSPWYDYPDYDFWNSE